MPRWYIGFRCGGSRPQVLIDQIAAQVQRYDLGHLVPVVRVEKQRGRGEFYLFLAIDNSSVSEVPDQVRSTLLRLSFLSQPLGKEFTYDEIKSMVGAEHTVHDYVRLIPYTRPSLPPESDPFEQDRALHVITHTDNSEITARTQRFDRLLYWLSANGNGSWQVFENTWQMLCDFSGDTPQRTLRRLRLLGHLETSVDRKRWSISPSALAQLDSGAREGQYVLCGQRDAALLQRLQRLTHVEELPQVHANGPATIYIHTTKLNLLLETLEDSGHSIHLSGYASLNLAQLLPTLTGWKDTLERLDDVRPHNFTTRRFDGTSFVDAHFNGTGGFYELWPLDVDQRRVVKPDYTLFYDGTNDRWLRSDWYGLRFLARTEAGQRCTVCYDSEKCLLAVPNNWRWPEIYERALVLASGRLPAYRDGWLIYESISPNLLNEFQGKLNLYCEEVAHA